MIDVQAYDIRLDLSGAADPGAPSAAVSCTITFRTRGPGGATWVDADVGAVRSAHLNGVPVDVTAAADPGRLPITPVTGHNVLTISSSARYGAEGAALHRYLDPLDGATYVYTHLQPAAAHTVFPCFDQPDLKAVFRMTVITPPAWRVVGNAPGHPASPGRHVLEPTPPLPPYLVAVVAGPLATWRDAYEAGGRSVPLGVHCRASQADRMDPGPVLAVARQGIAFYERSFGVPYPFAKYDQCFVPGLPAAGMENAACVTLRENLIIPGRAPESIHAQRRSILLHELAHMWFGDLVTMRWWGDLWLSESFATLAATIAQADGDAHFATWLAFSAQEKSWAYQQDLLPSTHPVSCDVPDVSAALTNFDGITYAKGAGLLRQLAALIGMPAFLAGVSRYLRDHAWGSATTEDFLAALSRAAGRDLSWWGRQWLHTAGVNRLRPHAVVDEAGGLSELWVEQEPAHPGTGDLRTQRVGIGFYADDGRHRLVRTRYVEVEVSGRRTPVPLAAGAGGPELILVNDDDLGYCLPTLDPGSVRTLISRLADVESPRARALCWSALWEMTRRAELPAASYVELTMAAGAAEQDPAFLRLTLQRAQLALGQFVRRRTAAAMWPRYTRWLHQLVLAAPPGSERRLAGLASLVGAVLTGDSAGLLRAALDRRALPDVHHDGDWRWRMLTALVANGAAGPAEIAAEAAADRDGARRALTATAALPDAGAKEAAWTRIWADPAGSDRAATIAGFAPPGQHGLVAPYAVRYFADLGAAIRSGGGEQLHHLAYHLFPLWAPTADTVRATDAWLAERQPDGLRRLITEQRAELARAVAAQRADPGPAGNAGVTP